ncbi:hypothetical protein ANN_10483 [Periplaneta americana]|uniref:Uncharacterized protein n=1 Tax=Periplaneta americana TaxID=6978 RepID=A0ABQ8TPE6_PERAM|nr:hypothetical protein ANN_10483 [Periplaneta americana]
MEGCYKMVGNVAAVRAIPGRSVDSNRCRHCFNEIETLAHVLGSSRMVRHYAMLAIIKSGPQSLKLFATRDIISPMKKSMVYRKQEADSRAKDEDKDKDHDKCHDLNHDMHRKKNHNKDHDMDDKHHNIPHIDVSLTCEHDPKLQEYCVCPQNMPQFDSEGIPNQAPETNKPMILNGPTSRNREGSDQVSVEAKQLGHLYLSINQETFDPSTGEPYDSSVQERHHARSECVDD